MNVLLLSSGEMREVAMKQLYRALSIEGVRVWIDWPIDTNDYRSQMLSLMNEADLVVFLVDQGANLPRALDVEWKAAQQSLTRKLVVRLGGPESRVPDQTFTYVTCLNVSEVVPAVVNFVARSLQLKLFISYSHKDGRAANAITRLARYSLSPVWIDKSGLSAGKPFPPTLEAAIEGASRFLLIWSRDALRSAWVEREWRYALSTNRQIAPVLIDRTPLPTELSDLHAFNTVTDDGLLDWLAISDAARSSLSFRAERWWRRLWH